MPKITFWASLLPASWQSRISGRPHLVEVVRNTGWLAGDRVLRMAVGVLVGIWVARYLGPNQFGKLSYALAIVALWASVAGLGLDNIVVRDLVRNPTSARATLGTCAALQAVGTIAAMTLAILTAGLLRPTDALTQAAVALVSLSLLFKTTDAVRLWFDSQVQARHTVLAEISAFMVFAIAKVVLVLAGAPLLAFAWVIPAEAAMASVLLVATYMRQKITLGRWKFDIERARVMLRDSVPLVLSAAMASIYMRIDQLMLGQLASDSAVGIYAAAARLSEAWYFIPVVIGTSVFPALLNSSQNDRPRYQRDLQDLFLVLTLLAFAIAVPVTIWADRIVAALYGQGYAGAADVLIVHVWSVLFVFHGVAGSRWFLAENLQSLLLFRTLAGCVLGILLNVLLIPSHGAVGAAWSTVAAQAMATLVFNAFSARTRPLFMMQLQALTGASLLRGRNATGK